MSRTFVLYHANCSDGFGAAWAAWRRLGNAASYLPVKHAEPPPELAEADRVFLVDFAYGRAALEEWVERGIAVRVLDHHKTAADELVGFPGAHFDMDKSGAVLSWDHFHPGEPPPPLLAHIQDRDLWRHELAGTRSIMAALASYRMDFELWSELADDLDRLRREGDVLVRAQDLQVHAMCRQAYWVEISGHRVPVVNASVLWSDVGNALLELFPDALFAGVYNDIRAGVRKWSLRSRPGFDVGVIAKANGGGGHAQAAGYVEELPLP